MKSVHLKISFDIGGVVSRHPSVFVPLIQSLTRAQGIDVYVMTDMLPDEARAVLNANGLSCIDDAHILEANWMEHGEDCKLVLQDQHDIDLHIDDHAAYARTSPRTVGCLLMPSFAHPYYGAEWKHGEEDSR